ncbi:Pentatricopeptide repeat-containing protein [Platanthera guangdongensis]|uniref:Pentatricopeptide repeat-containing protein n=1 Tax=Platanthera guangdongensis TaxID=2320717 RepID=A0ABR2MGC2_9ASPA
MISSSPPLPAPPPFTPQPPFLNAAKFINDINASAAKRNVSLAAGLHATAVKSGLIHSDLFVANAFVDAYAKCDRMDLATNQFDQMPHRDIVSWTSLISGHCRSGSAASAVSVFRQLVSDDFSPAPNEFTISSISRACVLLENARMAQAVHGYCFKRRFMESVFVSNSLISAYSKLGFWASAEKLLDGLDGRNVVSWSTIISGYVLQSMFSEAIQMFTMMLEDDLFPNFVTMLSITQACSLMNEPRLFTWIHAWILKMELGSNAFVANSLVEMYCKNKLLDEGIRVFVELWSAQGTDCIDPDAMAAIVRGCTLSRSLKFGRAFHGFFLKQRLLPRIFVENSMIDMYGKLDEVDSANQIFREMEEKDLVSWNTMISCLLKKGHYFRALELVAELHGSKNADELAPDDITVLSSIQACAELASAKHGEILHGYAVKTGFDSDVFVSNSLILMYAKSGKIEFSEKIFGSMDLNDLSTWNTMILSRGINGDGEAALSAFQDLMKCGSLTPNAITFVNVITACSHSGLVEEGYQCFKRMRGDYGIEPEMEHYASAVDLFARSGKLEEAEDFIRGMPMKPGAAIWGTLLGACGVYGDVGRAERAAEELSALDPNGNAWKVSLSKVYGSAGRWREAARVREDMKKCGARKEAGWSSVEVNGGESGRFMVGDTKHPEAEKIYAAWNALKDQIKDVSVFG